TCLPALSLMALATSSQACFLREEITTFAPCSAIRSAIARPMPREEPVMTATFPLMSNKVISSSPLIVFSRTLFAPPPCGEGAHLRLGYSSTLSSSKRARYLRQLAGCDFGPGGLVHGGVPDISDPGLLVDHREPPIRRRDACKMVEPRHRAI